MIELPTEEDVLAMCVLCAVVNDSSGVRDYVLEDMLRRWIDDEDGERYIPVGVLELAKARRGAGTWTEAIADSERRWETEKARDAVVRAASDWQRTPGSPELTFVLLDVVRLWRRALFAVDPTVLDGVR